MKFKFIDSEIELNWNSMTRIKNEKKKGKKIWKKKLKN